MKTEKAQVQKRLDVARLELLKATARGEFATQQRFLVSHLEAAIKFWVHGKSEKSFIV